MRVSILWESGAPRLPFHLRIRLRKVLKRAAGVERIPAATLVQLIFTDDEGIKAYNRRYRGIDAATDVLSFPQFQPGETIAGPDLPGIEKTPLGDIVVSHPRGVAQAASYGHSAERELCFLALHGFLHLLGYDHEEEEERRRMERRSEEILSSLGIER